MGTPLCVETDVWEPCNSQAILPKSKPCKRDFLHPHVAEWLPHDHTWLHSLYFAIRCVCYTYFRDMYQSKAQVIRHRGFSDDKPQGKQLHWLWIGRLITEHVH
jgi:hypothetical protein